MFMYVSANPSAVNQDGEQMDAKKKDRTIMAIAVLAVAGLMAALAWIVYSYTSGGIDETAMMAASSALSGALMVTVLLYGIYVYRAPSAAEQYKKMLEEKEKKND